VIRAIIVDDEEPSLDRLEKLLNDSGLAAVEGKFTEPLNALEFLNTHRVDAVFLDIEMPDIDGLELAGRIMDSQGSAAVVFVTAYNQYAVEAFRLNALDYLMKPVMPERLSDTLCRIAAEKNRPLNSEELCVVCFGRFGVYSRGMPVRFRTKKAEELLAYLIDRRGSFISRSEILDSIWGDFEGDRALIHFNTTLHYMKKALLEFGASISIAYDRGGYRFNLTLNCDYLEFCAFLEKAGSVDADNIREAEKTAGLYTKDYLSGWEDEWVEKRRLLLEDLYVRLLLKISGHYQRTGDYQKAADWLKAGIMRQPVHRELNYRLLEALLLGRDRASAVKYYKFYKRTLKNELGEEPDEAFRKQVRDPPVQK
jgi:two-component SAPR family response regulator